uniref:NADH dehydrogenase subunit 3 n=1 Tax=Ambigolimax valentianus TaxID=1338344 RepID=UPI00241199F4|nr:NADH dehydrogenase subunit 3 [Ambigolimax valentianus]WEI33082.1 NADH dehydrogenase subunit 3 [Ambigolimax valentianus]
MLNFSLLVLMISLLLLLVYIIISWTSTSYCSEKNSPFECGFDPLSGMRNPFSTRFFVLVVLFLIFDIEVSLLFPLLSMLSNFITFQMIFVLFSFLLLLLSGLLYEWYQGALDWVSQ